MTQVRPAVDDTHLFDDPAALARDADDIAQQAFDAGDDLWSEVWQGHAKRFRRMAANGERVPKF